VVPAHNGHEAFRLFIDHPEIALLFTDIVMPGIDGFKLAGMVRMMRPSTRLLFATGYMDLVPLNPAFLKGELINKPYRAADLEAAVEKVLSRPA
jgi:YesN/AraC family two-component response regulator